MRTKLIDTHSIHVRLPVDLLPVIDDLAKEKGVTRTAVIIMALRNQLGIAPPAPKNVFKGTETML